MWPMTAPPARPRFGARRVAQTGWGNERGAMTQCRVTIAVYRSLTSALAAWDELELAAGSQGLGLIDAALVEGDADTIRVSHRHLRSAEARGAVASAIVGLLRPPAIVTGAVAGGVGGAILVLLGQTLSRDEVKSLGEVLDSGPIALIAVASGPAGPVWDALLRDASVVGSVDVALSQTDIRGALQLDAAG